jgi:ADP-heptose:LPS heptosyltransferase
MKFLVSRKNTTGNIYGQNYELIAAHSANVRADHVLVTDEVSARELLLRHPEILSSASLKKSSGVPLPKSLSCVDDITSGSKLLLLKNGGIGDHVLFTCILKFLRENRLKRGVEIYLAVQRDMFPIYGGLRYIDELISLPVLLSQFVEADYLVEFAVKWVKPVGPGYDLIDYYMQCLGLSPRLIDKRIGVIPEAVGESRSIVRLFDWIRKEYRKKAIVLLNWNASSHIKSFPPFLYNGLARHSDQAVFLVVHPRGQGAEVEAAINRYQLPAINVSPLMCSLYDYFTAVRMSDAVACADTSMYHIAAAYGKPSLIVFGPTYSILTRNYPMCKVVDADYSGRYCCSPCGRTKGNCPEADVLGTPYSPCLMSVDRHRIADQMEGLIRLVLG